MAYRNDIPNLTQDTIETLIPAMQENFSLLEDAQIVEHNLDVTDPSNGYYVRWNNGLQVCFHEIEIILPAGNTYEQTSWDFPASFVETPRVFPAYNRNASTGTTDIGVLVAPAKSASGISVLRIIMETTFGSDMNLFGDVLAIGRWK